MVKAIHEKAFYKLISNAVYGKAMKQLSKRLNVRLVDNYKDYLNWTSKPNFVTQKVFNNDLQTSRPAHVGMRILELIKVQMYEFHYDYIKNKYGNKLRLLFTDADSLVYKIETENIYDNFIKNLRNISNF